MILNDENYTEIIESYNEKDWQPLFELLTDIEKTSKFGEVAGRGKDKNGVIQMPNYIESSIVTQFVKIVYELPIIISFDWSSWDGGRKIAQDENFDFDTIDISTKCKLLTAIIRNDRFCEGTLVSAFDSGLILKILLSIRANFKNSFD
jgi:hypothetical protein